MKNNSYSGGRPLARPLFLSLLVFSLTSQAMEENHPYPKTLTAKYHKLLEIVPADHEGLPNDDYQISKMLSFKDDPKSTPLQCVIENLISDIGDFAKITHIYRTRVTELNSGSSWYQNRLFLAALTYKLFSDGEIYGYNPSKVAAKAEEKQFKKAAIDPLLFVNTIKKAPRNVTLYGLLNSIFEFLDKKKAALDVRDENSLSPTERQHMSAYEILSNALDSELHFYNNGYFEQLINEFFVERSIEKRVDFLDIKHQFFNGTWLIKNLAKGNTKELTKDEELQIFNFHKNGRAQRTAFASGKLKNDWILFIKTGIEQKGINKRDLIKYFLDKRKGY